MPDPTPEQREVAAKFFEGEYDGCYCDALENFIFKVPGKACIVCELASLLAEREEAAAKRGAGEFIERLVSEFREREEGG